MKNLCSSKKSFSGLRSSGWLTTKLYETTSSKAIIETLQRCSGLYRDLIRTGCAFTQPSACKSSLRGPASWTHKTAKPAQNMQILNTRRFRCKSTLKFCQSLGILLHTLAYYILCSVDSKKYPQL